MIAVTQCFSSIFFSLFSSILQVRVLARETIVTETIPRAKGRTISCYRRVSSFSKKKKKATNPKKPFRGRNIQRILRTMGRNFSGVEKLATGRCGVNVSRGKLSATKTDSWRAEVSPPLPLSRTFVFARLEENTRPEDDGRGFQVSLTGELTSRGVLNFFTGRGNFWGRTPLWRSVTAGWELSLPWEERDVSCWRKLEAESCSLSKTKVDIKVEANVSKVSRDVLCARKIFLSFFLFLYWGKNNGRYVQILTNETENNRIWRMKVEKMKERKCKTKVKQIELNEKVE